jgi:hypothetical protein
MKLGETVTGTITARQLDVWAIELKAGDKITVVDQTTKGDLQPDVQLFRDAGKIASADSGDYKLTVTCTGGPCAGEAQKPLEVKLDDGQKLDCITKARQCTFEDMKPLNGDVGTARARELLDACLAKVTLSNGKGNLPLSCKSACSGNGKAACDSLVAKLPWFADRSQACLDEWDVCMSDCYQGGDDWSGDDISEHPEMVCVHEPVFNGNCWYYVQTIAPCGGKLKMGTEERCREYCENTTGAWMDDLDTICIESCP